MGTGEEVYESRLLLRLSGEPLVLKLVLHTWQADRIIQRTTTGATLLMILTTCSWILGYLLIRLYKRGAAGLPPETLMFVG